MPPYRFRLDRKREYGITTLELNSPETDVQVKILSSGLGKRERRALARDFLRQIRPWIERFHRVALDHSPSGAVISRRSEEQGLKTFEGTPSEVGFEIRMKRLKFGLSQAQLAQRAGIQRSYLSEIERGIYKPSDAIRTRIDGALAG